MVRILLVTLVALAFLGAIFRFTAAPDTPPGGASVRPGDPEPPSSPHELIAARPDGESTVARAHVDAPRADADPEASPRTPGPPDRSGTQLEIRVLDATTDRPLAGFPLVADQPMRPDFERRYETGADGRVATEPIWRPGTVHFDPPPADFETGTWVLHPGAVSIHGDEGTRVVELRAEAVTARIDVEVRGPRGAPLAGATATRVLGTVGPDGSIDWNLWRRATTDERGRARFFLRDSDRGRPAAVFLWSAVDGQVSDVVRVEPPLEPGPWVLETYAAASLGVRVTDRAGVPLVRSAVWLRRSSRLGIQLPQPVPADAEGRVAFDGLPAETFDVSVRLPDSDEWLEGPRVELAPGEHIELEVPLDAALPPLAVEGLVVDAHGGGVEDVLLEVELEDGSGGRAITDREGRFEYRSSSSSETVLIRASNSVFADELDPAEQRVPFGSRGVVVRRMRVLPEVFVVFELVDAETGAPVGDDLGPAILVHRSADPDGRVHAVARFGPTDGVTEVDFRMHDDLHWFALAPGYREARGSIAPFDPDGDPPHIRVELEPGFERRVVVRDDATGEPLANARFAASGGALWAVSDAAGHAHLEELSWPDGALQVTCPGYRPLFWEPGNYWNHHDGCVWLRRAE